MPTLHRYLKVSLATSQAAEEIRCRQGAYIYNSEIYDKFLKIVLINLNGNNNNSCYDQVHRTNGIANDFLNLHLNRSSFELCQRTPSSSPPSNGSSSGSPPACNSSNCGNFAANRCISCSTMHCEFFETFLRDFLLTK